LYLPALVGTLESHLLGLLLLLLLLLLLPQGRIQAFTQSPAVVEPQPGEAFSWFNGNIAGKS
jgi:hypothetical protein